MKAQNLREGQDIRGKFTWILRDWCVCGAINICITLALGPHSVLLLGGGFWCKHINL